MFVSWCRIAPPTPFVKRQGGTPVKLGARLGIAAVAILLLVLATGFWYFWTYPLRVYALMNTRALAGAGLTRAAVPSSIGGQSVWTGGAGPTLVLLHGAGDSAGTWSGIVKAFTPRYRVVIPDLAGHGGSAPAEGPISVGQVLKGLEAVMQQGPQDPAIIVGNSLGAWAAMLYAREHPDRVARLVLVNGGALVGDRPDLSLMPKTREEAAALMTQLRDPSAGPIPGFVLDNVVREAQNGPIARLVQTAGEMSQYVLEGKLHEVTAPADLLWGESDKLFSIAYARRMMAQLPAARLTTIPACGHVPQQECPVRFGAALSDLLTMPPPLPGLRNVRADSPGAGSGD
jgi:pimeloyl-ACP methyl ester carboxylesterase